MNQNQSLHTPRTSGSTAVEDLPAPSGFPEQLTEIYPVPPLARRSDAKRSLDFDANMKIFRHLVDNGVTRIVYGGNAFLYQITMAEYAELTDWLGGLKNQATIIPAVGSSYGRAMDQAPLIRRYGFPSVLVLPTGDPRDAIGMERGMHEIANACGVPLMLYVKHELDYGADIDAGIEAIGRLVDSKVCAGIKYAIVRKDPAEDAYLARLVQHVDPLKIISGIGERPAVTHLRKFKLSGFTTGSGVVCRERLLDVAAKSIELRTQIASATFEIGHRIVGIDTKVLRRARPVLEAFIEEDIEIGGTPFDGGVPGFIANREAACQAFWRGPSMPQADELKTAMAAQIMCEIGLPKSIAYRAYGVDPDDAADERARERDYEDALDLEPGTVFGSATDRAAAFGMVSDKPKEPANG